MTDKPHLIPGETIEYMDESLINLCKEGNTKAQQLLYEQYAERMFRLCYRYLQNQMDAEDMVVNGFVKIFQSIKTFDYRGKETTEAWMKKIMVNECLMLLRKRKALLYNKEEASEQVQLSVFPEEHLEVEEIYSVILKLPVGYRTVFSMYAIEGFTHKEIGQQLGISENTSKSQLHKAKIMLQELLIKRGITYGK